jgi:heme-degrading monooxygenase HmoA
MTRRSASLILVPAALFAAVAGLFGTASSQDKPAGAPKGGVYEMRTYTTNEGKLDALNARFRNHTLKLFEKHGMKNVMYWTPTDAEKSKNTLIYVLWHESEDAAKKSFAAFVKDPDWIKARDESEKDGKIVAKVESVFMKVTDYSPHK